MPDASRTLELKLTGNANPLKGSLTELRSTIGLLREGVQAMQQVWNATVQTTIDLGNQVDDLSDSTGMTAEESSKLIGVFKLLNIDTGMLARSALFLRNEGLAPSVDTLANLSDKFLAIHDPVARTDFLVKHFGKSGLEMADIMERGSDTIRGLAADVGELGAIMSEQDVEATKELSIQLGLLNLELEKLQVHLGKGVVPWLVRELRAQEDQTYALEHNLVTQKELNAALADYLLFRPALIDAIYAKVDAHKAAALAEQKEYETSERITSSLIERIKRQQEQTAAARATDAAVQKLRSSEILLKVAEAILAGDYELAAHLWGLYEAAKSGEEKVSKLIDDLEKLSGKKFNTYLDVWITEHGGSSGGASGTIVGYGGTYTGAKVQAGTIWVQRGGVWVNTGDKPKGQARGGTNLAPGVYELGEVGTEGLVIAEDGSVSVIRNEDWNAAKGAGVRPRKGFWMPEGSETDPQHSAGVVPVHSLPTGGTPAPAAADVQTEAAIASIEASKANVQVAQETTRTLRGLVVELRDMLTQAGGIRY